MSTSLLQGLLAAGCLDIGDDDDRFEKMENASAAMADALVKNPADIIPCVLVGLDPNADEKEPIFDKAEAELLKEWRALRNKFPERPRSLLRAILLDAAQRAGEESPRLAAVAWLTAADMLPFFRLGREEKPIRQALLNLGTAAERLALGSSQASALPAMPATPLLREEEALTVPQFRQENVQSLIEAAVGPRNRPGTTLNSPNPHWPNSPDAWAYEFAPRMSKALITIIQDSTSLLLEDLRKNQEADRQRLSHFLTQYATSLQQWFDANESRHRTERQKIAALWWSESMYSPSLRDGYRRVPPEVAAVSMAIDLHMQVDNPAPSSVAYLLAETVARLPQAGYERKLPLKSILATLQEQGSQLRALVSSAPLPEGRVPLFSIVEQAVLQNTGTVPKVAERTGLEPNTPFTLPALAMACFRGLQARALVQQPS